MLSDVPRILVIDDEESIRVLYHDEFQQEGYRVQTAASAEEALKYVITNPPDLIILDIKLGQMDGIEFLRKMRDKERNIPVVVNTAYGEFRQDFALWASDAYVTKSSDLTELKLTVHQLLHP